MVKAPGAWDESNERLQDAEDTRDALLVQLDQAQAQLRRARKRIRQLHRELRDIKNIRVES